MSEVWVTALIGVATTVGTTAYAASQAPGFGGAPPVKFNPIDVNDLSSKAAASDIRGYDLADADLANRFPGLVSGNKENIASVYKNLTGPLDPTAQNAFATNALENSLSATGGGNANAGVGGVGSFSGNTAAASVANQVQAKQDYDRSAFDAVLAANPQRQIGLSGETGTQLAIGNAANQNQYDIGKYQYQVQKDAAGGGGF